MRKKNRAVAVLLAGTLIAGCRAGAVFAESTDAKTEYMASTEEKATEETEEIKETEEEKKSSKILDDPNIKVPEDWIESDERIANGGIASVPTEDVEPGASEFSEKITYQTYEEDSEVKYHVPEAITINGEEYLLKETSNKLLVSHEGAVPKTYVYESEVFTGDESEHEPEEEVAKPDATYYLKSKTLVEQQSEEREEYKETVVSYNGVESGIEIKEKKEIEFTDVDTGQTVTAELSLANQKTVREYWDDSFQFEITINGYDADVLILNGKEIGKDEDLMNYTDDLLAILNLDPSAYKINLIDLQPVSNNTDVRTAIAYGSKYVKDIEATYGGTVKLPSVNGKVWSCVYEEEIPDGRSVIYTMSATVAYERSTGTLTTKAWYQKIGDAIAGFITAAYEATAAAFKEHPVIASIPVVAVAALLAFFITKKIRNRCIYNDEIKCPYKKHNKEICKSCPNYRQRNSV